MHKIYLLSISVLTTLLFSTSTQAQRGITFNGTTQYIDCTNSSALAATAIRTMECWVKFNNFTNAQEILSRSITGSGIELLVYNNALAFYCMNSSTSASSNIQYASSNLSTGVWYHVAVTWGNTKESMRLYVNGVSVGTRTDVGNITAVTNPTGTFRIGQWYDGNSRYFNGSVDDVRIWSTNRTAAEIKAGMYGTVATTTTGLIAYYKFDETSGTTATNSTATTGINGTLTGTPTRFNSPVVFAQDNGLNFDGTNDQVVVPTSTVFNLTSGTFEAWIHPSSLNTTVQQCIAGYRGTSGGRYSFHVASNQIGLWNGSSYTTLPYTFTNGAWYHVAFVCNGTSTIIYVNNVNVGTIAASFGTTATGQPFVIGIAKSSTGDMEPFAGDIDEVRVWSTQRTLTQIRDNRNVSLTGSETGLVALYSFNQGLDAGANAGLVYAIDGTSSNNHGTLTNFSLNSTSTSNWKGHSTVLPVELTYFTASRNGDKANLRWATAQEQNSRSFIIERSTDGQSFSSIGTVAAAGNSNSIIEYAFTDAAPKSGINYYRLQQVDIDGQKSYSKIASVQFAGTELIGISPNPASSVLHYSIYSLQKTQATVTIFSAAGQKMQTSTIAVQTGNNTLTTDIHQLPAGVYTLQVLNSGSTTSSSLRFSVVK
ncbi:MAG: T9SS type A sorting domain-containing protein [Chitinophagaceae bacterium]